MRAEDAARNRGSVPEEPSSDAEWFFGMDTGEAFGSMNIHIMRGKSGAGLCGVAADEQVVASDAQALCLDCLEAFTAKRREEIVIAKNAIWQSAWGPVRKEKG